MKRSPQRTYNEREVKVRPNFAFEKKIINWWVCMCVCECIGVWSIFKDILNGVCVCF